MPAAGGRSEVAEDYKNALGDLSVNSKPLITMLTMLAEENKDSAAIIVKVLGSHICETEHKLPAMYLIDSIVKNVGNEYKRLFSNILIHIFSNVFRHVEEKTRKKLYELRQTWNDVFPQSRLYLLDVTINEVDPAWPITSQPRAPSQTPNIHVNPSKLKAQNPNQIPTVLQTLVKSSSTPASTGSTSAGNRHAMEELEKLQKEKKILDDNRKTLERLMKKESADSKERITKGEAAATAAADQRSFLRNYKIKKKLAPTDDRHISSTHPANKEKTSESTSIHVAPWKVKQIFPSKVTTPVEPLKASKPSPSQQIPSREMRDPRLIASKETRKGAAPTRDPRLSSSRTQQKSSKETTSPVVELPAKHSKSISPRDKGLSSLSRKERDRSKEQKTTHESGKTKKEPAKLQEIDKSIEKQKDEKFNISIKVKKVDKNNDQTKEKHKTKEKQDVEKVKEKEQIMEKAKEILETLKQKSHGSPKKRSKPRDGDKDEIKSKEKEITKEPKKTHVEKLADTPALKIQEVKEMKTSSKSVTVTSVTAASHNKTETPKDTSTAAKKTVKQIDSSKSRHNEPTRLKDTTTSEVSNGANKKMDKKKNNTTAESDDSDHYDANRPPAGLKSPKKVKKHSTESRSSKAALEQPFDTSGGDIDLRQLTGAAKPPNHQERSRASGPMVELFGTEDVDLRRLGPPMPPFGSKTPQTTPFASNSNETYRKGPNTSDDHDNGDVEVILEVEQTSAGFASPLKNESISDLRAKRNSFNSPNAASWEKFRARNPQFKEYQRQASLSEKMDTDEICDVTPVAVVDRNRSFGPILEDLRNNDKPVDSWKLGVDSDLRIDHPSNQMMSPQALPDDSRPYRAKGPQWRQNRFQKETPFYGGPRWSADNDLPEVSKGMLKSVYKESETRSIHIDGTPREIRTYGDRAIILMRWDDPRTLAFENMQCNIVIDEGHLVLTMWIGEAYRDFTLDGKKHRVKLGVPSQEILIDGKGYQCFFGGKPITVYLDGKNRTIRLDGRPPQVDIGLNKNIDYLLGKIELDVHHRKVTNLYLDAKPQVFDIDGRSFVLKFLDCFNAVTINGVDFPVNFGGRPILLNVNGQKRFLHFPNLPAGVIAGKSTVKGLSSDGNILFPSFPPSPPRQEDEANRFPPSYPNRNLGMDAPNPPSTYAAPNSTESSLNVGVPHVPQVSQGAPAVVNPLAHHGVTPGSYSSAGTLITSGTVLPLASSGSGISNPGPATNMPLPLPAQTAQPPVLDIHSLLGKLTETGLIGGKKDTKSKKSNQKEEEDEVELAEDPNEDLKNLPPILEMFKLEHLRKRNRKIIARMYRGLQCSSCGLRYPSDQTAQYSHHLDWHFRMNKKQQESSKKPNSRKYYLCIDDWIQYEEIEDLDERVPSLFDADSNADAATTKPGEGEEEVIPSVAVTSDASFGVCPVCHETFDQFYHQTTEEWHYKHAIVVDGVNYHPGCHQDLLKTLKQEEEERLKKELEEEERLKKELEEEERLRRELEEERLRKESEEDSLRKKLEEDEERKRKEELESKEEITVTEENDCEEVKADDVIPAEDDDIKIEETHKKEKVFEEVNLEEEEEAAKVIQEEEEKRMQEKDEKMRKIKEKMKALSTNGEAYIPVRIKEEPTDTGTELRVYVPKPIPPLLADLPIKMEIQDELQDDQPQTFEVDDDEIGVQSSDQACDEPETWPTPTPMATALTDLASSIDGNTELTTAPETSQASVVIPKIKISVSKPSKVSLDNEDSNGFETMNGTVSSTLTEDTQDDFVPPPFSVDLTLKPAFEGVDLTEEPVAHRGVEVSSFCTIM